MSAHGRRRSGMAKSKKYQAAYYAKRKAAKSGVPAEIQAKVEKDELW